MKICKECKWLSAGGYCVSPRLKPDLVNGVRNRWASTQRLDPPIIDWIAGTCGSRGRFWEKKEK